MDESCAGWGTRGRPCQCSPVLLLHSPHPCARRRELLLAVFMPSGTSAAPVWFISCRSLEQSTWVSIPYTSASCLQLSPGTLNTSFTFLCNAMILSGLISHMSIMRLLGPGPGREVRGCPGCGGRAWQWAAQSPCTTSFGPQAARGRVLGQSRARADSAGLTASDGEWELLPSLMELYRWWHLTPLRL